MFDWVLNTPLINYFLVLTLTSIATFRSLAQRNPFTAHDVGWKNTLENGTLYWSYISENLIDTVRRTCRSFNSFNSQQFLIFLNHSTEYLHVVVVCMLKINAKLQEKTFARWDIPFHHVRIISFVNLQRFRPDRLCFNDDAFSCGMVLLITLLLKRRINFHFGKYCEC